MNPVVMIICAALLVAAAVITLFRVERGPSMLDRIVALDVLVSCLIGGLALVSLWSGRTDLVLVLTVLALVGFVGSVTLARFAAVEPEDERRILTPREAAVADARERFEDEIRDRLEDGDGGRDRAGDGGHDGEAGDGGHDGGQSEAGDVGRHGESADGGRRSETGDGGSVHGDAGRGGEVTDGEGRDR